MIYTQTQQTQKLSESCCLKFQSSKCIQCSQNYHLYRNVCIPNIVNCQTYFNGFDCQNCKEEYQLVEDIEKNIICRKSKQYQQQIILSQEVKNNKAILETDDFLRTKYSSIKESKLIRAQFRTFPNKTTNIILIYQDKLNLEKVYEGVISETSNKDIYNFIGFFSKDKYDIELAIPYVKKNLKTQCSSSQNISIIGDNKNQNQTNKQQTTTATAVNTNNNNTTSSLSNSINITQGVNNTKQQNQNLVSKVVQNKTEQEKARILKQQKASSFISFASGLTLVSPDFYDKTPDIILQQQFLRKINSQLQGSTLVAVFKKQLGIYAQYKLYFELYNSTQNKLIRYEGFTAYHLFTKAINIVSFGPVIF